MSEMSPGRPVQNASENVVPSASISEDDSDPSGQQQRLFSGLRIVSLCTLLSRALGLIRDIGMAALFGLSPVADHFVVAFSIPNLTRRLFGEGALSASFLPVLTREFQNSSRESVWSLVSAVFMLLTVSLSVLVLAAELCIWGFLQTGGNPDLHVLLGLTAAMLPYLILICLAAQISAVLHVLGHFTLPALVPVVLNICWIFSLWFITPLYAPDALRQAYVISATIVLAGGLQVVVQWPMLRRFGFRFQDNWQAARPCIGEILSALPLVMFGLSTTLVNTLADRLIAWGFARYLEHPPIQEGAAAALYYAQRLYHFPLGVFGVALGTVLFPLLAKHAAQERLDLLRRDLTLGLRLVVAVGLPAGVGLVLLAQPLARTLFQYGEFSSADATRTAGYIIAYGGGVWAFCGQLILFRAFYALNDRITPLRVGLISVGVNLVLNLTLIWPLGGSGLAYGTSISAILQVVLLIWLIQSRYGKLDAKPLVTTTLKSIAATGIMSVVCLLSLSLIGSTEGVPSRILGLVIPVVASLIAYYFSASLLGMQEINMLLRRKLVQD